MNSKLIFKLWVFGCLFVSNIAIAQTADSYKLPETYSFDYTVTQSVTSVKYPSDNSTTHFFYTKSGDYAAVSINGNSNVKGNLFIVMTRNGIVILFDERKKEITIFSVQKLVHDMSGLMKYIRMDSLITHMTMNNNGNEVESVKTGRNKLVGNYTSEEYVLTDNRNHKVSVWLAKVDFNGPWDYISGVLGGTVEQMMKMMSGSQIKNPLMRELRKPPSNPCC